jgi:hypothetical protein
MCAAGPVAIFRDSMLRYVIDQGQESSLRKMRLVDIGEAILKNRAYTQVRLQAESWLEGSVCASSVVAARMETW